MSVPAIGPVGVTPTGYVDAAGTRGAAGVGPSDGGAGFGISLAETINALQAAHAHRDGLAVQAVTGDLDDVHDYMIAATEAKVAVELTAAVRNKAVDAFTEIMRMQA